jgi:YbbR domain-containing protein
VTVRLKGPQSILRALTPQTLQATVDLGDVRAGQVSVILRPQTFDVPQGVEVVSINPPKLLFSVEQRRQKVVPIRPFVIGEAADGSRVIDVTATPSEALVSGPLSTIREMSEVATERIILTGRNESFDISVGIVSDRPLVRIADPVNTRVSVLIERTGQEIGPPLPSVTATTTSTSTSPSETIAPPSGDRKQ